MDVGIILVFALVFLLSYFFFAGPKNLPPGPSALPVLGSLGLMRAMRKKRPYLALYEAAKNYGSVFTFKIGNQRFLVLNGYDVIKEALVKKHDVFSGRPVFLPLVKLLIKDGGGVLFNDYNHDWKVLRRFTLQALRDFGVGKSSLEEQIETEIDATSTWLTAHSGQPVDLNASMQKLVGNVIFGIVFGERYDYDDPDFDNVRLLTNTLIEGDGPISPMNFFPDIVVKLIKLFVNAQGIEERTEITNRIEQFIKQKVEQHEATFDESNIRDFVDLHLKTSRDNEEEDNSFTRGNLFRVINDLFLAGSETTSTTLDWVLLYMIEYPEVQKKCQAEIEEMVGDKFIKYSDREKLPYVYAVLVEVQRLSGILPLSVAHSTTEDTDFHGYSIPRDTVVFPNLYSASMDPKYWNKPEVFNPDRFLGEDGKLLKAEAWVPFSTGPRQCLGEPLAKMELFMVFANLIQRFHFRRENEAVRHTFEDRPFQITSSPLPYKVRIASRT